MRRVAPQSKLRRWWLRNRPKILRPRIFCDEAAYRARLGRCLDRNMGVAVHRLRRVLAEFSEKATGLDIGIHASQDAGGDFSVMIHLVGPDSYALNKPFENGVTFFRPGSPNTVGAHDRRLPTHITRISKPIGSLPKW